MSEATESVWDYPRPPAVRRVSREVRVVLGGQVAVETDDVVEVLETSHPPTLYLPRSAFATGVLVPVTGSSWCEFKGKASYADVVAERSPPLGRRGGMPHRPRATSRSAIGSRSIRGWTSARSAASG